MVRNPGYDNGAVASHGGSLPPALPGVLRVALSKSTNFVALPVFVNETGTAVSGPPQTPDRAPVRGRRVYHVHSDVMGDQLVLSGNLMESLDQQHRQALQLKRPLHEKAGRRPPMGGELLSQAQNDRVLRGAVYANEYPRIPEIPTNSFRKVPFPNTNEFGPILSDPTDEKKSVGSRVQTQPQKPLGEKRLIQVPSGNATKDAGFIRASGSADIVMTYVGIPVQGPEYTSVGMPSVAGVDQGEKKLNDLQNASRQHERTAGGPAKLELAPNKSALPPAVYFLG